MKLSFAERMFVNSPIRGLSLRFVEPRIFDNLAPFPRGAHVLDLGCGNGTGLVALARNHAPASLTGIDEDPAQIALARTRLEKSGVTARLIEANAEKITLPAHTYDVITCTGCLHHVPKWKSALAEVARLLRHGGLLYMFEIYPPLTAFISLFAAHPKNSFTHKSLVEELPRHGLTILGQRNLFNLAGFVVARRTGNSNLYD
ncbi:MAG: methyltransferase domain-containing protein [Proteobacteria bacterium]|nr:methyltransferase domain-containing protein [Pseudomonadota bacterium]